MTITITRPKKFFKMLLDALKETNSGDRNRRTVNPFYDRKDVAVQRGVIEFTPGGWETWHWPKRWVCRKNTWRYFLTYAGHPLFVELLLPEERYINMTREIHQWRIHNRPGRAGIEVLKHVRPQICGREKGAIAYQKVLTGLVRESIIKQSADNLNSMMIKPQFTPFTEWTERSTKRPSIIWIISMDNLMEALHHLMLAASSWRRKVILDKEENCSTATGWRSWRRRSPSWARTSI